MAIIDTTILNFLLPIDDCRECGASHNLMGHLAVNGQPSNALFQNANFGNMIADFIAGYAAQGGNMRQVMDAVVNLNLTMAFSAVAESNLAVIQPVAAVPVVGVINAPGYVAPVQAVIGNVADIRQAWVDLLAKADVLAEVQGNALAQLATAGWVAKENQVAAANNINYTFRAAGTDLLACNLGISAVLANKEVHDDTANVAHNVQPYRADDRNRAAAGANRVKFWAETYAKHGLDKNYEWIPGVNDCNAVRVYLKNKYYDVLDPVSWREGRNGQPFDLTRGDLIRNARLEPNILDISIAMLKEYVQ